MAFIFSFLIKRSFQLTLLKTVSLRSRSITYIQGQSPERNTREYFYFVDHEGQLFMDDSKMKNFTSCFKDKNFLQFFFKLIRVNKTGRYEKDFPFVSPCGKERNYVRCDDLPIVFTQILESEDGTDDYLSCNHTANLLKVKFEPHKIFMDQSSGRVYHPGPERTGKVGLIKSSLAIQLSQNFVYEDERTDKSPVYINWKGMKHTLTQEVSEHLVELKRTILS